MAAFAAKATTTDEGWDRRPLLGGLLTAVTFVAPVTAAVICSALVSRWLPSVHGAPQRILWWFAVVASSTAVLILTERCTRRLTPLAALLKMSLVFPDLPPSRLAMARKAGSTRDLERRIHDFQEGSASDDTLGAEQVLGLAAALSVHDRRTRGHSERVRMFTDLISDQLQIPEQDRDRLRWSALLHDVGKLAVDPKILNKNGKPTDEEWQELRTHPAEGGVLITPLLGWLGHWGLAVEQHHESYDGTGYPHGLAGDDISLGGRIVAVADAFEVITARRSYKDALSPRQAQVELSRCSGTQFDPEVVRALLDISVWRLRWAIGPSSWLAQLPFIGGNATGALGAVAGSAAGAVTITAGSLMGWVPVGPSTSPTAAVSVVDGPSLPTTATSTPALPETSRPRGSTPGPHGPAAEPAPPAVALPTVDPVAPPVTTPPALPTVTVRPVTIPPVSVPLLPIPPVTIPPLLVPPLPIPPLPIPLPEVTIPVLPLGDGD